MFFVIIYNTIAPKLLGIPAMSGVRQICDGGWGFAGIGFTSTHHFLVYPFFSIFLPIFHDELHKNPVLFSTFFHDFPPGHGPVHAGLADWAVGATPQPFIDALHVEHVATWQLSNLGIPMGWQWQLMGMVNQEKPAGKAIENIETIEIPMI